MPTILQEYKQRLHIITSCVGGGARVGVKNFYVNLFPLVWMSSHSLETTIMRKIISVNVIYTLVNINYCVRKCTYKIPGIGKPIKMLGACIV